jgi:uncharacterized protein YbaR (Trm112 family)
MLKDLMDILACPVDKGELRLVVDREEDGDIVAGSLTCSVCGETYPIEESVPNLLPPDLRKAVST